MAKNNDQQNPIENYLRGIVRDELSRMFSGTIAHVEDWQPEQPAEPQTLNTGRGGDSSGNFTRTGRGRRAKRGKGRVVNRSTDRRFKANREMNA